MKLCLPLLASLLLVVGCKTDKEESTAGSAAPSAEQPVNKGRSGKIDLPKPRQPAVTGDQPALPDQAQEPGDDDRRARREERRKQRMADLDKDGDGQISEEERAEARKARMDAMSKRLDTNNDGKLTVEELKASRMGGRFDADAIDVNKDGVISPEELQKSMDDMRTRGWGGGRFGGARGRPMPDDGDKPAQPQQP